eukprot:gnl/TRDRNA2_/TRDRNA2_99029_c1_seq1.p1 gnl/TRDRNA2_/TRDRNA2_99029_c1~~gnl/TRDRNA2_/TRDRNA2_99029_c1_seq1.p1  ORF type:complete len:169 (+),score=20.38 gnl/TRDRNA2_/TRDRNA2_99029_c1_seq1:166-672(+)
MLQKAGDTTDPKAQHLSNGGQSLRSFGFQVKAARAGLAPRALKIVTVLDARGLTNLAWQMAKAAAARLSMRRGIYAREAVSYTSSSAQNAANLVQARARLVFWGQSAAHYASPAGISELSNLQPQESTSLARCLITSRLAGLCTVPTIRWRTLLSISEHSAQHTSNSG